MRKISILWGDSTQGVEAKVGRTGHSHMTTRWSTSGVRKASVHEEDDSSVGILITQRGIDRSH